MGKRVMMIGLDGADPFVIKRLIGEGRLPNLKKAIENGVVGENMAMIGAFPSVTPPNWASLATGNWPKAHGVTCFFNHTLGNELDVLGMNWDAMRVESELIWEKYAEEGKKCLMLNYCEAWPPRDAAKDNCIFIDGTGVVPFLRCQGGYQKVITLEEGDFPLKEIPHFVSKGAGDCVVYGDAFDEMAKDSVNNEYAEKAAKVNSPLNMPTVDTRMPVQGAEYFPSYEELMATGDSMCEGTLSDQMTAALREPSGFAFELPESAKAAAVMFNTGLLRRFFVISASDGVNYDTVTLYEGRKEEKIMGQAKVGEWSDYIFDTYNMNAKKEPVVYRFRVLEMDPEGKYVKIYLSHQIKMNGYKDYCYPANVWDEMYTEVGPFVPFGKFDTVDHTALEATVESWQEVYAWHEKAADWLFKANPDWELFYTHVHGIDEFNHWFLHKSVKDSNADYAHYEELINRMYEINDHYVGKLMEQLDDGNTAIFITSDHAAIPHSLGDTNPGIGSLAAIQLPVMTELGLTKYYDDEEGGHWVKWDETVAVAQRSSYIYINLKGRDPQGIVEPEDYDKTVQMVIDKLYGYRHPVTGERVISFCLTRDEMEMVGMGGNHVGDILYQVVPTYCNEHAFCPSTCTNEGYSLNNLCIMTGAGFKQGVEINRTIRIVDVVPTICHLGEVPMVSNVEGGVIWQALEGFEEKSYK